jgi:hypothetical protein
MSASPSPERCPLCGEHNACGMAAGAGSCWCFSTKVPADVLERVPQEARDKVCVCEACANGKRGGARTLRVARDG